MYLTNPDCIRAGKPLVEFDLYVGTLVFAHPPTGKQGSQGSSSCPTIAKKSKAFPDGFPVHLLRTTALNNKLPTQQQPSMDELFYDPNVILYTLACSNTSNTKYLSAKKRLDVEGGDSKVTRTQHGSENTSSSASSAATTESFADRVKYGPNCSEYMTLDFSMTSFEHLPVCGQIPDFGLTDL